MKNGLTAAFLLFFFWVSGQNPLAYQWFAPSGGKSDWKKVVQSCLDADVILFGEQHDDPIAHWFQLQLLQSLVAADSSHVRLGEEMLERDQQWAIDLYQSGQIDEEQLMDTTKMWSNFNTDYLPSIHFAVQHHIPVVATNIPRRYASMVFKKGVNCLDTLPESDKAWITPLPFVVDTSLSQYHDLVEMGMQMHASGYNFAAAQAVKDATMAHFILANWAPGVHFLHFEGAYHSDFDQSIEWYLRRENPKLKIVTISTVTQSSLKKLSDENKEKADFILVTPEGMTRTM